MDRGNCLKIFFYWPGWIFFFPVTRNMKVSAWLPSDGGWSIGFFSYGLLARKFLSATIGHYIHVINYLFVASSVVLILFYDFILASTWDEQLAQMEFNSRGEVFHLWRKCASWNFIAERCALPCHFGITDGNEVVIYIVLKMNDSLSLFFHLYLLYLMFSETSKIFIVLYGCIF